MVAQDSALVQNDFGVRVGQDNLGLERQSET
jgi:hypothetical protein